MARRLSQASEEVLASDTEPWMREVPMDAQFTAHASLARDDDAAYIELAMAYEGMKVHPHGIHTLMMDALKAAWEARKHLVLVTPPESGKTSIVEKWLVKKLGEKNNLRIGLVSASERTARRNQMHARKTLVSPLTKNLWPTLQPDVKRSASGGSWSAEALYLVGQRDPAMQSYSLLSDAQGLRLDILWMDDVITRECRFSEAMREDAHSAIHEVWMKRLTGSGIAIITNNVWSRADSIHRTLESPSFFVLWIGYEDTDRIYWRVHHAPECWPHAQSGKLGLWKAVWPKERLEMVKQADPPAYKRLYMQQAVVADESRLPTPDLWATYEDRELPGPESGARVFAYLDPAGGKHVERGDFAALMVGVLGRDKTLYVLDAWVRRTPPTEQIGALWEVHKRLCGAGYPMGLHTAWVEVLPKDEEWIRMAVETVKAKAMKEDTETPWPKILFDYPDTASSKESRIENLHTPLETGSIKFPAGFIALSRGDSTRSRSWGQLIAQFEDFGSKACDHDDAPDALTGLWSRSKMVGPGLAAPGSGIIGRGEQRLVAEDHKLKFAKGKFERDIHTGRFRVKKHSTSFIK